MKDIEKIIDEARELVSPTPEQEKEVGKIAEIIKSRTLEASKGIDEVHSIELGGSYEKGTWLKDHVEIDIFVKFSPKISRRKLEQLGIEIGKKTLSGHKWSLRYSEHPYVEGYLDTARVNVVACYDVAPDKWISAADRSPHHTKLIKEKFDSKLKIEARLLKKFLKVCGIYGAEIKTQGLSGYVCEVLILKYGSFMAVVEAAAKLSEGDTITINEATIRKDKFNTPLVITDPVDLNRNLGAAISSEKAATFILVSRRFTKSPSLSYFKETSKENQEDLIKTSALLKNLVTVIFNHKPRTLDVLWGQLKRSEKRLVKQLEKNGFTVWRSSAASDEDNSSGFIFLLESLEIPKIQVRKGPKADMSEDAETFLEKNHDQLELIWIGSDMRINSVKEKKIWKAEVLLNELLKGTIRDSGVAPRLKDDVKNDFNIYRGKEVLKTLRTNPWLIDKVLGVLTTHELSFGEDKPTQN